MPGHVPDRALPPFDPPAFILGLLHKEVQLVDFLGISLILGQMVDGLIIAADDLLVGCFSAGFIVKDAEASHIYTHIGGGFIGLLP